MPANHKLPHLSQHEICASKN